MGRESLIIITIMSVSLLPQNLVSCLWPVVVVLTGGQLLSGCPPTERRYHRAGLQSWVQPAAPHTPLGLEWCPHVVYRVDIGPS